MKAKIIIFAAFVIAVGLYLCSLNMLSGSDAFKQTIASIEEHEANVRLQRTITRMQRENEQDLIIRQLEEQNNKEY